MRWYHYTGMHKLNIILLDESLLSYYEKLRRDYKGSEDIEKIIQRLRQIEGEREYQRNNNIFLTPLNNKEVGMFNDIVFGFELDEKPNLIDILILPKVSLDNLVDIGSKKKYFSKVKETLQTAHHGKYKDIPTYEI